MRSKALDKAAGRIKLLLAQKEMEEKQNTGFTQLLAKRFFLNIASTGQKKRVRIAADWMIALLFKKRHLKAGIKWPGKRS